MKRRATSSITILCLVSLVGVLGISIPQNVSAGVISGTTSAFEPGTYSTISIGTQATGNVIIWYWVSYDNLLFYVVKPDGSKVSGPANYGGIIADMDGQYWLQWYNNNWLSSATVSYTILAFAPQLTIDTPTPGEYLDTSSVTVQGTYDGYADGILVGPDALHLKKAQTEGKNWGLDDLELAEGQNTILVRSYYWLDLYGYENHTVDEVVQVTVDTVPPEVVIIIPAHNAWVAGEFTLSWQCSDECGIALKEVRVDLLEWVEVEGCEFSCDLDNEGHWVAVRVTDLAGNRATASVNFFCDSNEPAVYLTAPDSGSKIDRDTVTVSWTGFDLLSGIDHYEVRISGGEWIYVGAATNHTFTGLEDQWYSVTVRAVDRVGNSRESSASFGIYTSIWSENGPYQGIPLFALIAAIIIGAVLITMLFRRRRGGPAVATAPEELSPEQPLEGVPVAD